MEGLPSYGEEIFSHEHRDRIRTIRPAIEDHRYYEDIGLVRPTRTDNGYRDYSVADIHRLRFVQRSRSLGFSVEECRQLLSLYHDRDRDSADVKAIAEAKLAEIERKIAELAGLRHVLHHLVEHCQDDDRPDCPIIDELAGDSMVQ